MKGHIYSAAILLMVLLTSCTGLDEIKEGGDIVLSGRIGQSLIQTRSGSGPVQGNDYGTLTLGMARVDAQDRNSVDFSSVDGALKAEMTSDGSSATLDPIVFTDSYQTFKNVSDWVNYASWYPYADVEDGTVAFKVDGNTDVLYGDVVTGRSDTPFVPVTFNHSMTKFKVWVYAMVPKNNVTGEMAYDPDDVWGTISSLTVEDVPLSLTMALPTSSENGYVFTPSADRQDFVMSVSAGSLPFGSGTVLPSSFPLDIEERKAIAEFMIPPTSILSLNVTATGPVNGEAINQNISFAKDFKPGCHYDIVLKFSDHGLINADVKVGEWTKEDIYANELTGDMFYDLSENETANCYVVSSANYNYCFNATVKGNGAEGVVDGTDVNLVPDHAVILWADKGVLSDGTGPGFVLMNDGKISDGRVLFAVRGAAGDEDKSLKSEGNILIGVYDQSDNLIWTWHIWMCDPPQRQGYKNGFSVHDRDLGAVEYSPFEIISKGLETDAIDGLYYQWGRPTPLPFGRELSNGAYWSDMPEPDETEDIPLAKRIVNPHKFYTTRLNEGALSKLWGWRSASEEYVKTIYDPCPPGYRVPSNRLWRELKLDHEPHIGQNGNNHSIHFSVDDFNEIFYPVSGYYMAEDGAITNKDYSDGDTAGAAYMWAATYDSEEHNPYNLEFKRTGATTVGDFRVTSEELHSFYALPVRCVSRKSTPHVEDLSASQTANSYIVQDQGYFKFNAGVRGNGVGKLVSPGTAEFIDISEGLATDISGSIVKVKPLWWQEAGGVDMIDSDIPVILDDEGRVNDGYVMFHIDSFREGNLILAGYDESETIILWTWHLWLTDAPKQLKSHNFAVMDRNLGATHAPSIGDDSSVSFGDASEFYSTVGLYFQWGRKDPFVSPEESYYYFDGSSWEKKTGLMGTTESSGQKTIPYSVQNPMNFNYSDKELGEIPTGTNNISSWESGYDDIGNQCFSTYRLPEARPSLWGYSSASGLGKTTTKTMYDPCPPGYCVAFYTVWTNDSQQYYTNLDSGAKDFPNSGNDKLINEFGIVVDYDNTFDPTWYPFSGYIDGKGNMTYYKTEGRFHSSTPAGNGSRSLYYTTQYTGQAVSNDYKGIPSSYAYPVRCQKQ